MPFVVYPLCVVGLLIWAAFEAPAVGATFVALGIIIPITAGIFRVRYVHYMWVLEKNQVGIELVTAAEAVINDS